MKEYDLRLAYFKADEHDSLFTSSFSGTFMFKFASVLVAFLDKEKSLFQDMFNDAKLQHMQKEFYEKMLSKVMKEHKEKIIQEFIYGTGLEA